MTVWEIKNKSGLSDENINFYKKEGLFCPKYEKTGYRDYTETDLNILLRIKLLRQLGISIDRIKLLQAGKTELTTVLD